MNGFLYVLPSVLVPVATHVFNRVALAEVQLVSLDEFNGLDLQPLVVASSYLMV